jgi:hypothetical protein
MKLSDLKVGEKLGISVYLLKVIRIIGVNHPVTFILGDKDGHINDIISNITETYIEFGYRKWRVDISLLYEKGLLEKEFELPAKWYVLPKTIFNLNIVKNYFINKGIEKYNAYSITYEDNAYDSDDVYYTHSKNVNKAVYTEITFEQFKKYVLKESMIENNKLPEKWYIKRKEDNYEVVNNWFNNNAGHKKKHSSVTGILFYPNCSTSTFQQALLEGYKELTFEEFKDYVLNKKQQKVMFTKQDWIERKCVIKFDSSKRAITTKFLKECNKDNSSYEGIKPYIVSTVNRVGFWGAFDAIPDNLPVVTINELLNPNNMVENKKIVGYKVIGSLQLTKEEEQKVISGLALTLDRAKHPEAFEPIYEENLELGGYKLEFTKTTMKFDGATFKKAELEILEEVLEDNSNIHITLKSIPVNLEMLKKIIKNFK